jgi:hypothetical protein
MIIWIVTLTESEEYKRVTRRLGIQKADASVGIRQAKYACLNRMLSIAMTNLTMLRDRALAYGKGT